MILSCTLRFRPHTHIILVFLQAQRSSVVVSAADRKLWYPGLETENVPSYLDGTLAGRFGSMSSVSSVGTTPPLTLSPSTLLTRMHHLSLPTGDYGFDPLRLGSDEEQLKWYVVTRCKRYTTTTSSTIVPCTALC